MYMSFPLNELFEPRYTIPLGSFPPILTVFPDTTVLLIPLSPEPKNIPAADEFVIVMELSETLLFGAYEPLLPP